MAGNVKKLYGFKPERWGESTKLVFENNYFGENQVYIAGEQSGIYNFFELDCSVANGSKFNNNVFTKNACHNVINFYQVDDGTEQEPVVIEIKNNTFECLPDSNPFRIGCKGAPQNVRFYVEGNKYVPDPETEPDYVGLFFIQPYVKQTEDLSGISIYLKDNDVGDNPLFYYYAGKNDAKLIDVDETKLPKVFIYNNTKKTYEQVKVLDYAVGADTLAEIEAATAPDQEIPSSDTPETPTTDPNTPVTGQ